MPLQQCESRMLRSGFGSNPGTGRMNVVTTNDAQRMRRMLAVETGGGRATAQRRGDHPYSNLAIVLRGIARVGYSVSVWRSKGTFHGVAESSLIYEKIRLGMLTWLFASVRIIANIR